MRVFFLFFPPFTKCLESLKMGFGLTILLSFYTNAQYTSVSCWKMLALRFLELCSFFSISVWRTTSRPMSTRQPDMQLDGWDDLCISQSLIVLLDIFSLYLVIWAMINDMFEHISIVFTGITSLSIFTIFSQMVKDRCIDGAKRHWWSVHRGLYHAQGSCL